MGDNNMSDLEQLLEDLGRPKSVAPTKKARASVVNLNELEALMTDLADAPAPPRVGASKVTVRAAPLHSAAPAAAKPPAKAPPPAAAVTFEADDLDSIMDALNGDFGNSNSYGGHGHNDPIVVEPPYQAPPAHTPAPAPAPPPYEAQPSRITSTNTIDELEDLLNGLEDTRASVRVSSPPAKTFPGGSRILASPSAPAPAAPNSYGHSYSDNQHIPYSAPINNIPVNNHPPSSYPSTNNHGSSLSFKAPTNNYSVPNNNYPAPTNNYSIPANNYSTAANNHGSSLSFKAPTNNYNSTPTNNYSTPTNNYSAPANNPPGNQYKPEQRQFSAKPPAVRPMPDTSLDMLLGDLQEQLKVVPDPSTPSSHGSCAACNKPILGELISALGRRFHPEHFTCGNCMTPLGTSNFYEQDGVPNCERCYQELLCPRCAHCDEPILDRCVTALGKKWHMDHFICTQCLSPFPDGSFYERDSRPFCERCFSSAFAPRCGGCNQPIQGPCINALGQAWHPEHFVCQYCQKAFTGSFFDFGGKPYCDLHYHQQTGSLCGGCNKAVTGKCVDALGKKWHPDHFVCAFCMNPLAAGSFTENGNKAYCRDCHGKLFG
jgi:paxillin